MPIQRHPPEHPPDTGPELTHEEVQWVRAQRKQHEHETWLRGQVRVIWPWVISIVGALVAAAMWIKEHVKL